MSNLYKIVNKTDGHAVERGLEHDEAEALLAEYGDSYELDVEELSASGWHVFYSRSCSSIVYGWGFESEAEEYRNYLCTIYDDGSETNLVWSRELNIREVFELGLDDRGDDSVINLDDELREIRNAA